MITKEIKNWTYGIVDKVEPTSIPLGSLARALNFLTLGDHMELRRGSKILGADAGAGSVGGLHVAEKLGTDAEQVVFKKVGRKLLYYTRALDVWTEIGSDVLPAAAEDDDFAMDTYSSQAGAQVFGSSPNSSIYKILIANPGSITDLIATTYRGYLRIKQSRTFLWNRHGTDGQKDEQDPFLSYIDAQNYTTVTAEALADAATGTLAFKGSGAKRTCFGVVITVTAGGEIYRDQRDGTLLGSLGSAGTIDYTTGAYTTAGVGAGTADYQWEDSTNQGLADFSYTGGTRTAGQGNFFPQGEGGPLQGIETYGATEYCMHKRKTYALTIPSDDTNSTNLIFRDNEGVPNWRAVKGTSKGVFYLEDSDQSNPKLKRIVLTAGSTRDDDEEISINLDLSGYRFDRCAIDEFDPYIIIWCRTEDSEDNNRAILYHKDWNSFDVVDYWGLVSGILDGSLVFGESITGNVVEGFSGVDDDEATIDGFMETNEWDIGYPGTLKKVKNLELEGNIGPDQVFDVQAAPDGGPFVTIGQIRGDGSYVDRRNRVIVGPVTLGRSEVGGGSTTKNGITAYHYFRKLPLRIDKFERVSVRLVRGINADDPDNQIDGIGYFSLSTLRFRDVRLKAQKLPQQYR